MRTRTAFRTYYLAAGATFWVTWLVVVAFGLLLGPVVPEAWHLEFAIPILFIGLLVLGIDIGRRWWRRWSVPGSPAWPPVFPTEPACSSGAFVGIIAGTLAEGVRRE